MTDPGAQTPSNTPKPLMSSNTTAQKRIGRDPLPKSTPTIDPEKLTAWGISGDQTDPLYLLQQLKKHVAFHKKGRTLVTKIAPLEEAFTHSAGSPIKWAFYLATLL
ncbi:hypothetical protein C8J57DRAFT_1221639 [Mycena rebaudengoi]|nr:hypothetical protein C8J57DRAFT_1221639 [Mycena rebaudengoi]